MDILIRTDASSLIGSGHVMRCLALAQAWQMQGGKAIFVLAQGREDFSAKLAIERVELAAINALAGSLEDAAVTTSTAHSLGIDWIVLDGYQFNAAYQQYLKQQGLHLLCLDDYGHAEYYYADLVLNQNISADPDLYVNRAPYTQLLLGTQYTLLRREFFEWHSWQREIPSIAKKILITMGGADPENVTLKVIQALSTFTNTEVVVVIGANNPHSDSLQMAIESKQYVIQNAIRLVQNVDNMAELMAWADLAITAGGTTCWELAFMGLPSIVIILAENQRSIGQRLDEMKVSINLGWYQLVSVKQIAEIALNLAHDQGERKNMCARAKKLINGFGQERVIQRVLDLKSSIDAKSNNLEK